MDIKVWNYDYSRLDAETRQVVEQKTMEIRDRMGRAAQNIVEIGQRLIDVKARLPHGQFGRWLEDEFAWSEPTALRMMQVAKQFKSINLTDLSVAPSALYLLSSPSTPPEIRDQFIEQAKAGEKITHKAVKGKLNRVTSKPADKPQSTSQPSPDEAEVDEVGTRFSTSGDGGSDGKGKDAPAKPEAPIDKYPWEQFNREVREQIKVVRREVDRLGRIMGHSGKSFKSKWAYFISADGTIGAMRRALDSIDDNLPGGPHPKEPGFEPYRSVKLRAK